MFVNSSDYLRGEACVKTNVNVGVCEWQAEEVTPSARISVRACTVSGYMLPANVNTQKYSAFNAASLLSVK